MRKGMFEQLTEEQRFKYMFLMDRVIINSTKEKLEECGLDESYNTKEGMVDLFYPDGSILMILDNGENIKLYDDMIDEADTYLY